MDKVLEKTLSHINDWDFYESDITGHHPEMIRDDGGEILVLDCDSEDQASKYTFYSTKEDGDGDCEIDLNSPPTFSTNDLWEAIEYMVGVKTMKDDSCTQPTWPFRI